MTTAGFDAERLDRDGAASTAFWVDPAEEITCVFMTQLMLSSSYPLRRELKPTVYQALR